jgi:hypothetical protein
MQDGAESGILVPTTGDLAALLTRLVLEGGHEMITPARTLTLVHAVQQPLGSPTFVQLPVVHQPSSPIYASGLRNSFTPITAWRTHGSHNSVLLGGLQISGETSSKIDLQATWHESVDNPSKPAPTSTPTSAHVETVDLSSIAGGPIYSDATETRMVAVYIPKVDTLWFAAPFDDLDGVTTPFQTAAPVHRFDDTKHRWVTYTAIGTSRFQEYFPSGLDFTRTGEPLIVDVPSSARPLAPEIAYVIPTFGWENQESTNVKSSIRFGNGLRVYLNRPWFSSGDSEQLGVVLWPQSSSSFTWPPDYPTREKFKPYFTQWGNDPIWTAGELDSVPTISDFTARQSSATQLTLEETPLVVDVAGHAVVFDQQRGLWFCDIKFDNAFSYAPFVRLALARYQSHSIQGVELSRVVLADYAQLAPNRSAVISIDPQDSRSARVFVGGLGPDEPFKTVISVSVESRIPTIQTDLGWQPAVASAVTVTEDAPAPSEPASVLWSGTILFTKTPPPGQFRVVIREYELIAADWSGIVHPIAVISLVGQRLVYAAIIPYDYPS